MRLLLSGIMLFFAGWLYAQGWEVTTISNDGLKPVLAIDKLDRVHIVYLSEAGSGWVRYAMIDEGEVTGSTVSTGYFYGPPDITYDNDNNPVIAYHDHDTEDQAVRRWQNNGWQNIDTRDPGHDGWDNSILVDANGNIHTSSVNPFNGPGVEYGFYDGNSWTVQAIGSGPIMYANATSIALDGDNIYISYFNDQLNVLQFASRVNGTWQIQPIDENERAGRFSSMVVDELGNVYISYYAQNGHIKLAQRINDVWSTRTIDSLNNVFIGFSGARNLTSLAAYDGALYIAYGDRSIIKLAKIVAQDVTVETVLEKTDQDFGQMVSLDFTSEGVPYIAFPGSTAFNNPLGKIFVAHRTGTSTSNRDHALSTVHVAPNPVRAGTMLELHPNLPPATFALWDLQGRVLERGQTRRGRIKIPLRTTPGVYLLQLQTKEGKGYQQKVLVTGS